MKPNAWIRIPFKVLIIKDFQNPSIEEQECLCNLECWSVPADQIQEAIRQYSRYYQTSAIFNMLRKEIRKEPLDELEIQMISEYRAGNKTGGGNHWVCYWNGTKLIWRMESYSAGGDPSLPYVLRNSTDMRYHRRTA